jgi:hypothetical protein
MLSAWQDGSWLITLYVLKHIAVLIYMPWMCIWKFRSLSWDVYNVKGQGVLDIWKQCGSLIFKGENIMNNAGTWDQWIQWLTGKVRWAMRKQLKGKVGDKLRPDHHWSPAGQWKLSNGHRWMQRNDRKWLVTITSLHWAQPLTSHNVHHVAVT